LTESQFPQRLLAGPALGETPEPLHEHVARLGGLPRREAGRDLIANLEASGLLGRGGAGFPVGRKWRSMAERPDGRAVVVANGAEGEPASFKDRVLMANRPHLVIDGAILAAEAIGADEIVLYIGREHEAAVDSMSRALDQRRDEIGLKARVVQAPIGYVAGEASAVVNFINRGKALPTTTPPRISERGVGKRPTLVQNVESLAYAALIARYGERWYRSAGRLESRGTGLVTLSGAVRQEGVLEIELGTPVGEIASAYGGREATTRAVMLGGYFGTWASAADAWSLPLDPAVMKAAGLAFGCGIVGLLPHDACGVEATARIVQYLAKESAAQCGPCLHGLQALGEAAGIAASGRGEFVNLDRIQMLTEQIAGRGACHHPDGAVQLMVSALNVFGDDYRHHARTGRCSVTGTRIGSA
jgi:NADH:ubiquinone oxidoreductase subunit F (NADH-binding)